MKKIIASILMGLLSSVSFAQNNLNISQINTPDLKEHWKLIPNTGFLYTIENPTHANLKLFITMYPTTKTAFGEIVPSAPVELNCGGQIFYMDSSFEHTVCQTTDDVKLTLIHIDQTPSEGEYQLKIG